jgi:hypothetical protein
MAVFWGAAPHAAPQPFRPRRRTRDLVTNGGLLPIRAPRSGLRTSKERRDGLVRASVLLAMGGSALCFERGAGRGSRRPRLPLSEDRAPGSDVAAAIAAVAPRNHYKTARRALRSLGRARARLNAAGGPHSSTTTAMKETPLGNHARRDPERIGRHRVDSLSDHVCRLSSGRLR